MASKVPMKAKMNTELVDWKMERVNLTNSKEVQTRKGERKRKMGMKWPTILGNHVYHHVRTFL